MVGVTVSARASAGIELDTDGTPVPSAPFLAGPRSRVEHADYFFCFAITWSLMLS